MAIVERRQGNRRLRPGDQPDPDGPPVRYRVRYRRPDGRETSRAFDRAGEARAFASEVEADRRSGAYVDPAGPRTLFADMAGRWAATAGHADSTGAARDADLRNHVLPALGHYRLGEVGPLELKAFLRTLEASGLADATIQRVFAWVTGILAAAVEAKRLPASPAAGLMPPKPPRPELVPLEGDQVEAILAELPDWYRTAAMVAADAGLRNGEVFGLTRDRVGLRFQRDRVLPVERQLVSTIRRTPPYLRYPKRNKTRAVPVGDTLAGALAEHMATHAGAPAPDRITGRRSETVFATTIGTPVRRNTFQDSWASAVRRAGLAPGVRFHDLRHYYASVLIDAGVPEREIAARLGHSVGEVTARYGHLFRHAEDRTRDAVEASVRRRRLA